MADAASAAPPIAKKKTRDRSPPFPFIPLQTAVDRLVSFEKHFGRHATPADKAGLAWGMRAKSSQADQTLAAMRSYGLINYSGVGAARQITLTDEARTYLRAQQDSIKSQILKQCALRPKIIRKFWAIWQADRPVDVVALDTLVLENAFSDQGAETFLKVYDATIAYAGLRSSDKVAEPTDDDADAPPDEKINVGDLVQVEISGVLQLPKAARVRAIQQAQGVEWVFVEGSEAGIPMDQIILERKGEVAPQSRVEIVPPILPEQGQGLRPAVKAGMKEEKNVLDEGEAILVLPENLSAESVHDLEYWLQGILKKAKRRAGL